MQDLGQVCQDDGDVFLIGKLTRSPCPFKLQGLARPVEVSLWHLQLVVVAALALVSGQVCLYVGDVILVASLIWSSCTFSCRFWCFQRGVHPRFCS